jgi:hypothetical protein
VPLLQRVPELEVLDKPGELRIPSQKAKGEAVKRRDSEISWEARSSLCAMRAFISSAAFLVKVSARMRLRSTPCRTR